MRAAPQTLACTWGPTADGSREGQAALGALPPSRTGQSWDPAPPPGPRSVLPVWPRPPWARPQGSPGHNYTSECSPCPPRTAGPPTPGTVLLAQATKSITHKSFPSSTARLVPISQASEPRLGDEHPPTPQAWASTATRTPQLRQALWAQPLPHSQPGCRAGRGGASALVSNAVSITHLGAHGALSLPAGRRPQSPGGGVSSAQAS